MTDSSPGDEVKAKKKRPDVAERYKQRKGFEEFVVKASLGKYLQGDNDIKTSLNNAIAARVDAFSRKVVFTSRAILTLIKELFEGHDDVLVPELPNIFDLTFVRHLMLGIEGCHTKTVSKEAHEFVLKHPELIHKTERYEKDSNVYTYGVNKYVTNLKNALKMNLEKQVRKYLKSLENLILIDTTERIFCLYSIMGWKKMPVDCCLEEPRDEVLDIIKQQRRILGLGEGASITPLWYKQQENLLSIIRHRVFLNRLPNSQYKHFNIIPISKMRLNFITIDNDVFIGILKEIGQLKRDTNDFEIKELWRAFFKVHKHETDAKKFSSIVDTDGVSICIHFLRPKKVERTDDAIEEYNTKLKEKFKSDKIRHLACDPGRKNIYTIVEVVKNPMTNAEAIKEYTFTRQQYYAESGINKAKKNTINWSKKIEKPLQNASKVTTKGTLLEDHKRYLDVFFAEFETLWNEYTKPRWAEQRLRLYGGKKRSLETFWNDLLGKENVRRETVIAYGNAKFASGGKGEVSVPNSAALKACTKQKRLEVLFVDEFRTSKICYKTGQLLKQVKVEGADKPLRGLLWCDSTIEGNSKQGAFVNRDLNAAMNILICAKSVTRPAILDRKKAKTRLPKQKIGKILNNK